MYSLLLAMSILFIPTSALSSVEGNCFDDHIRVSFAHYNKGTLVQSAEKIAKALNRLLEKRGAQ